MTRHGVVGRLARCALARGSGRALLESPAAQAASGQSQDCEPSTSYTIDSGSFGRHDRGPCGPRGFCAWPSTAGAAQAQSQGLVQSADAFMDPKSMAEYERRLQELLASSRTFRGAESISGPSSPLAPSMAAMATEPAASAAASATRAASEAAGASSQPLRRSRSGAPSLSLRAAVAAAGGGGAGGCGRDGGNFAPPPAASVPPSVALSSGAGGAPPQPPGASSAAPAPVPPAPGPHPASPTPVDWREVLRRAREEESLAAAPSGRQMLTDKFRRTHTYLRISLTERCNLRCTYCMPAEGVALTASPQLLTTDEIMRLAHIFVEAGVTKIRLTGGEPTLRRDLPALVQRLSSLRPMGLDSVAITSNGIVLGRQLPGLKEAGLTAVNISLDTLRPERFEALSRRPGHERVMEAIRTAVGLGYDPVKVNVVVMRGVNEDEVADFAALTREQPVNVRFIEYMPFDGNVWSDSKMVPYRELVSRIQSAFPGTPLERLDDPAGEVAKNFRLRGHRGSVSFITSMTEHFCSDCNRLRLLADGSLKVCLFGSSEVSLRDAMRGGASDEDLRTIIAAAVGRKRAAHAGMFELAAAPNRPMITIGG